MSLTQQLIFLFSALGALNGFLLSGYFLLKNGEKRLSDYFLGGLLAMLSIRVIKSVFLFFNRHLFEYFIILGLTACLLIGPFLYLYTRSSVGKPVRYWWLHLLPYILVMAAFSSVYSYYEERYLWGWFVEGIYKQWLIYVLLSAYVLRNTIKRLFKKDEKLVASEIWQLNVLAGTALIWLAYDSSDYTSYIVGALSFTFILYLSVLLWVFNRRKQQVASDMPVKYAASSVSEEEVQELSQRIGSYMQQEKPYLDSSLSMGKLARQLEINPKLLSQVINQTSGQNYSHYIASLRVAEAQQLLLKPEYANYKIAAIAYESGFNSLSSFNAYFKKQVGITAVEYRQQHNPA